MTCAGRVRLTGLQTCGSLYLACELQALRRAVKSSHLNTEKLKNVDVVHNSMGNVAVIHRVAVTKCICYISMLAVSAMTWVKL